MADRPYPDLADASLAGDLTDPELAAIASLQRLAKRWPQSLKLVSMDGNLSVIRADDPRMLADYGPERQEAVIADIDGIPNDGGGW